MKTTLYCSITGQSFCNRIITVIQFACCFLTSLLFAGCSNLILSDFVPESTDKYPIREKVDGLEIVVQPFEDGNENIRIFGIDFTKMGYVPVLFIANNTSTNDSFIIKNDDISILSKSNDGSYDTEINNQLVGKQNELEDAATVTAFIVPIASLFASVEIQNMQEVKRNMVENKLYTSTVSPGKQAHGFIYLKLPDEENSSHESLVISVDAYNVKTQITNNIKVSLGHIGEGITSEKK